MCGRYIITSPPEAMRAHFGYAEQPNFPARHNVAPTQPVPVVRLEGGRRRFALMRWGLIPSWVKDPKTIALLINARAETLAEKPAFRAAFKRRRCLVPADGFYEWQALGTRRQPFAIVPRAGGPVAFAGVWETWTGPNGEEMDSVAIVTTDANRTLRPIHDRMPVAIAPEAYDLWLDCARVEPQTAAALLVPAPETLFEAYPVSTAVNRVANDTSDLLRRADAMPMPDAPPPRKPSAKKAGPGGSQGSLL